MATTAATRRTRTGARAPGGRPTSMTLHVYQVGFGDCFLLAVHYPRRDRHVLIDFGTVRLPPGYPKDHLVHVAQDIAVVTGGSLDAIVLTHRHRDHISGFTPSKGGKGPGDIIRSLSPKVVIQPWTEEPKAKRDATKPTRVAASRNLALVGSIEAMRDLNEAIVREASLALEAAEDRRAVGAFLAARDEGLEGITSRAAVRNLETMRAAHRYVYHGVASGLARLLPGVTVTVLGPPTVEQSAAITRERAADDQEFWMLQARGARYLRPPSDGGPRGRLLFPAAAWAAAPFPCHARWLVRHLRAARGEELMAFVRILDRAMNNTSVILLIEAGRQKLLFPGDAQIENWAFTLDQADLLARLEDVTFYKVGHHGSRNATPRTLWKALANKSEDAGANGRLRTVVSTLRGVYPSRTTAAKHTEVPRKTLIAALERYSSFFSTEQLRPAGDGGGLKRTFEIAL